MPNDDVAPTSPSNLLTASEQLAPAVRQRIGPFFIRMALEQALDEFWKTTLPNLAECSRRAQLLCLPSWTNRATAELAATTWAALSSACHYNTYELSPTAAELQGWRDDVAYLITQLTRATADSD